MAGAAFAGSALFGAAGPLLGGFLAQGGLNSGDFITPHFNPDLDPGYAAYLTDALSLIGRGDIGDEPDPIQQIAGQLQRLPIDEKTKRRALVELQSYVQGTTPEFGGKFLDAGLSKLGMTREGLQKTLDDKAVFDQKQADIRQRFGLDGLNQQIIGDRARAASQAAAQLGAGADFAATGQPQNELQRSLLERDNRRMANSRDQLGVLANFGNINPGQLFQTLADQEQDQELRILQQALQTSGALTGTFQGGNSVAGGAATGNVQNVLGATQLAAGQAGAQNQIRNRNDLDNALSLANGVSGAFGAAAGGAGAYGAHRSSLDYAAELNKGSGAKTPPKIV